MKVKQVLGRSLSIVAAAAMALVGTALPASAGTDTKLSYASNGDGWVYFVANGDDFRIRDLQCDGGTVYGQLTWYKSGYGSLHFRTIHNSLGCNKTQVRHPWEDIPEGADIWVRACGEVGSNYSNEGTGYHSAGHNCGTTLMGEA